MLQCKLCGKAFPVRSSGRGAQRTYCSKKCRNHAAHLRINGGIERSPGRPPLRGGAEQIEFSLSYAVIDFLNREKERDPSFSKSAYVDTAIREKAGIGDD